MQMLSHLIATQFHLLIDNNAKFADFCLERLARQFIKWSTFPPVTMIIHFRHSRDIFGFWERNRRSGKMGFSSNILIGQHLEYDK